MASIGDVGSIDGRQAARLRRAGIRTTEALLKHAARTPGRRELAARTGLSEGDILVWVLRADLMRVRGVGGDYADLLGAAGVVSLGDLGRADPGALLRELGEANRAKGLVRRLPSAAMVAEWVATAGDLAPLVAP